MPGSAWPGPLGAIDWTLPWFAPFADVGSRLASETGAGADLREALTEQVLRRHGGTVRTGDGLPARFVSQDALPPGTAYESHIFSTGCIPTRDNLHDFFNGLIWVHFPRTKRVLNRVQAQAIAGQGVGAVRGAVRDGATLFDENAALFLVSDPSLERALRDFRWQRLFVAARECWGRECIVVPFGHALLEKMVRPYKSLTAHAWPMSMSLADSEAFPGRASVAGLDGVDRMLAATLGQEALHARCFAPLPVMGVPGWTDANRDPAFYDDISVFRAGRRGRPQP